MPQTARKRRAQREQPEEEEDASDSAQQTQTLPIRHQESPAESNSEDAHSGGEDENSTTQQQMVKKFVRLALASEYSRTPLRRPDINAKVLGKHTRQFKHVFHETQLALQQTFGMELVELPSREKVTVRDRRAAAQKSQNSMNAASQAGNKAWILQSVLPEAYRTPDIIPPPKVPTHEAEAAYVGLYSFVIAVILLGGGTLPEAKLERYLRRTNAEVNTPIDRTDKLLQRMAKDGYIVKIKENVGGDEVVEYMVGPRGKTEVGEKGVAGMVRAVYGEQDDQGEELGKRIERSLKISSARAAVAQPEENEQPSTSRQRPQGRPPRNSSRRENNAADDGDESDD